METTLSNMHSSFPAVQMILAEKLPAKAGYAVGKLARKMESELKEFSAARDKAFTDAGCTIKEANGSRFREWTHADPAILEKVFADVEELGKATAKIDMPLIKIELFGSAEVPAIALATLDWAIDQSD